MNQQLLIQGNCLDVLSKLDCHFDAVFADPPDGIDLNYNQYDDKMSAEQYEQMAEKWVDAFCAKSSVVWLSFNARWTFLFGHLFHQLVKNNADWEAKPAVQVFTFGQHRSTDLGNNHRPLWRLRRKGTPLYPDAIRVPSWRQRNGDKRASSKGRVPGDVFDMQYPTFAMDPNAPVMKGAFKVKSANDPQPKLRGERCSFIADDYAPLPSLVKKANLGPTPASINELYVDQVPINPGDVFDFPRVTGNSAQRCDWHPTQLHEDLVERALRLVTQEGDTVLDPFGGTGTTLRVCNKINRDCTLIELDDLYCGRIRTDHPSLKFFRI